MEGLVIIMAGVVSLTIYFIIITDWKGRKNKDVNGNSNTPSI